MSKTTAIRGLEVGSPEWRELRKTHLGASEIGAVLGVNPYSTPVDVWMEKMGRTEPFSGNNATKWGILLEDLVSQEYAKMVGKKVRRYGYTLINGIFMGDLDRLVHDDGMLPAFKDEIRTNRAMDAKTARDKSLWADGLPAHYEAQGFTYMFLVPSLDLVDFATLFMAERDMDVYPLNRDDETIREMVDQAQEWWDRHIVGQTAPDPISEDDCKALWCRHRPETVCLSTPEVEAALARIADAKARAKQAEADEAEAKTLVMAAMQEREVLKSTDGRILATWKNAKDSGKTDWQAVAVEAGAGPELIKKHTNNVAGSRRFLPKNGK